MRECTVCNGEVEGAYRFCPWCAAPLRRKLVEFFVARPGLAADEGKALRVSRYLGPEDADRHVRFSVWDVSGRAEGAVSISDDEAARLARFLEPRAPRAQRLGLGTLLESLRR